MLRAGLLDRRIRIERAAVSENTLGEEIEAWDVIATVWAGVNFGSGSEQRRAAVEDDAQPATFTVRWSSSLASLSSADRIVHGGFVYNVKAVQEIGRREGLSITAITQYDLSIRGLEGHIGLGVAALLVGDLTVRAPLVGAVNGGSTLTGALTVAAPLAGSIAGAGSLTGDMTVVVHLAGQMITGAGSLTGAVTVAAPLAGAVAGGSTFTGALSVHAPLAGLISGVGALTGNLTVLGDELETMLAALEAAGKLVSAWFLPLADPDQYLTLNGANVEGWAAAYGSQKVNFAFETAAPQWDATLYSNKGGVTFNGSTQRMLVTGGNVANWPADTDDLYILAAGRNDASNTVGRYMLGYGDSIVAGRHVGKNNHAGFATANAISAAGTANGFAQGTSRTVGAVYDLGGNLNLYVDGASQASAALASAAMTRTRARLGAHTNSSAGGFWQGRIVAAAILNSTATLTDFTDLEALMRARLS